MTVRCRSKAMPCRISGPRVTYALIAFSINEFKEDSQSSGIFSRQTMWRSKDFNAVSISNLNVSTVSCTPSQNGPELSRCKVTRSVPGQNEDREKA